MINQNVRRYHLFLAGGSAVLLVAIPAILLGLADVKDDFGRWFLLVIESILFLGHCYHGYRFSKTPPDVTVPVAIHGEISPEEARSRYQSNSRKEALLAICVSVPLAVISAHHWEAMMLCTALFVLGLGGLIDPQIPYATLVKEAPFHKKILAYALILGGEAVGLLIVYRLNSPAK